jgi:RNA polymerase sigma-70 factor (ECF subfamily)
MTDAVFLSLIQPIEDKLFRLSRRYLISNEEAQDAVQEVVLKMYVHTQKVKFFQNFEGYAMRMARNYCLDRLKSKQAATLRLVHRAETIDRNNLDRKLNDNDSLEWVDKLSQNLPQQQKMILQLRDIEAYDFDEIAKIMEMNPGAVRVALSRARKTIRKKLIEIHNYGIQTG